MKKILAVMDFSKSQESIVENAVALALEHNAKIILGYVEPPKKRFKIYDVYVPRITKNVAVQENEELLEISKVARQIAAKGIEIDIIVIEGEDIQALIRKAEFYNVDIVLISESSRSWLSNKMESGIWNQLISSLPIPILVLPDYTDFFESSKKVNRRQGVNIAS